MFSWPFSGFVAIRAKPPKDLGKPLVPDQPSLWPRQTLEYIGSLADLWLTGQTLIQIENAIAIIRSKKVPTYCTRARELSQGVALDLSFAFGLLPQVWRASKVTDTIPTSIGVASACMQRGLSSQEGLALSMVMRSLTPDGEQPTRPQINHLFGRIAPYLNPGLPEEQFIHTKSRVELALLTFEMLGLTDQNSERNSDY